MSWYVHWCQARCFFLWPLLLCHWTGTNCWKGLYLNELSTTWCLDSASKKWRISYAKSIKKGINVTKKEKVKKKSQEATRHMSPAQMLFLVFLVVIMIKLLHNMEIGVPTSKKKKKNLFWDIAGLLYEKSYAAAHKQTFMTKPRKGIKYSKRFNVSIFLIHFSKVTKAFL